jgi:hypothetical protein
MLRTLAIAVACISAIEAVQEPRPVPLTSPVRVVKHGDDRLTGINAVDVLVEDLTPDAARCGLSKRDLQDTAATALVAAALRATISQKASSWFYTVYVRAHTAAADQHCVTAVDAELMTRVDGIPEIDRYATDGAWGSLLVGDLSLIRTTAVASSLRADHAPRVRDTVRDQLKRIGLRIAAANK